MCIYRRGASHYGRVRSRGRPKWPNALRNKANFACVWNRQLLLSLIDLILKKNRNLSGSVFDVKRSGRPRNFADVSALLEKRFLRFRGKATNLRSADFHIARVSHFFKGMWILFSPYISILRLLSEMCWENISDRNVATGRQMWAVTWCSYECLPVHVHVFVTHFVNNYVSMLKGGFSS